VQFTFIFSIYRSGQIEQNSANSNLGSTIFRDEFSAIYKCRRRLHVPVFITTANAKNVHRPIQLTIDSETKSGLGNGRPTGWEHEQGRGTGLRDLYSPQKASHFYFWLRTTLRIPLNIRACHKTLRCDLFPTGDYISSVLLHRPLQLTNCGQPFYEEHLTHMLAKKKQTYHSRIAFRQSYISNILRALLNP